MTARQVLPTKALPEEYQQQAEDLVELFGLDDNDLVIAIHSGQGELLKKLLEEGIQVLGIEPNETMAFDATCAGIETIADDLSLELAGQIKKKYGAATVITAPLHGRNLATLANQLDSLRTLLASKGTLILDLIDTVELASLSSFLARHSWTIVDVIRSPKENLPIHLFVQQTTDPTL